MEIWKDVLGYNGSYQVSNLGRVKSFKLNKEIILKNNLDNRGYLRNSFYINGVSKKILNHRLVAIAFIPNPQEKPQVNHINGFKTDNRVENLEWNTRSENLSHAYKNGLLNIKKGEYQNNSKLSDLEIINIRKIGKTMTQKEISVKFNISQPLVSMILKNKIWTHL